MGREEDRYHWLVQAAKLKWRWEEDKEPPTGMAAMLTIESVCGRLDDPPSSAANDLAALLLLLLLVLLMAYANSSTKNTDSRPFLCKKQSREIFAPSQPNPAWLLLFIGAAAILSQCHFAHLPTGGDRNGSGAEQ